MTRKGREIPSSGAKSRRRWSLLIGWLLSAGFIVGLLWLVPVGEVAAALCRINPLLIGLAVLSTMGSMLLRGMRWAVLLSESKRLSGISAASPIVIGLTVNGVLPGRLGDFVRIGLGARKFGTGIVFTATTVVADRMLDALTLLGMLGIAFLLLPGAGISGADTGDFLQRIHLMMPRLAVICLLALACFSLFLSRRFRKALVALLSKTPGVGEWLASRVERVLEEVTKGLRSLHRVRNAVGVVLLSILVWLPLALTNYLVMLGFPGVDLSVAGVLVVTAITIAASSIPAAPGAWGTFEAAGVAAMAAMGFQASSADVLAFLLVCHACQYVAVVLPGIAAMHRESIGFSDVRAMRSDERLQSSRDKRRSETESD